MMNKFRIEVSLHPRDAAREPGSSRAIAVVAKASSHSRFGQQIRRGTAPSGPDRRYCTYPYFLKVITHPPEFEPGAETRQPLQRSQRLLRASVRTSSAARKLVQLLRAEIFSRKRRSVLSAHVV